VPPSLDLDWPTFEETAAPEEETFEVTFDKGDLDSPAPFGVEPEGVARPLDEAPAHLWEEWRPLYEAGLPLSATLSQQSWVAGKAFYVEPVRPPDPDTTGDYVAQALPSRSPFLRGAAVLSLVLVGAAGVLGASRWARPPQPTMLPAPDRANREPLPTFLADVPPPAPGSPSPGPAAPADEDNWLTRGRTAYVQKRFGAALAYFRKALKDSPRSFDALAGVGQSMVMSGQNLQEATRVLERLLQLDASRAEAWLSLGMAYQMRRTPAKAWRPYREFLRLAPEHPSAEEVRRLLEANGQLRD